METDIPSSDEIKSFMAENGQLVHLSEDEKHRLASELLVDDKVSEAFKLLLS